MVEPESAFAAGPRIRGCFSRGRSHPRGHGRGTHRLRRDRRGARRADEVEGHPSQGHGAAAQRKGLAAGGIRLGGARTRTDGPAPGRALDEAGVEVYLRENVDPMHWPDSRITGAPLAQQVVR